MKRLTILLAALGALLLVSAAPALASEYTFKENFGSAAQPSFTRAGGMAIDKATGDLLVIDLSTQSIKRYKPNGEADDFSAIEGGTSNVIDGAGSPGEDNTPAGEILSNEGEAGEADVLETGVAVAPPGSAGGTAGDIYVTDAFAGVIDVFDPTGKYIGQKSVSAFPCGVAVDPKGNVFVGSWEGEEGVYKYTPTAPATLVESGASPFVVNHPCQVAAGEGFVYAAPLFDSPTAVHKIDSEGAEEGTTEYEIPAGVQSGPMSINPANGHLLTPQLFDGGHPIKEFDVSGAGSASLVSTTILASEPFGVAAKGPLLYATRKGKANVEVFSNGEEEGGPTNRRTLTLTKSAGGTGGVGTVSSKPKGIKCAAACNEAVGSFYENANVELSAKASTGSTFTGWTGACSGTGTCVVSMTEAKAVGATFGGTSKAIVNPQELTVAKEGSGFGTVKATGLACEAECTTTTVLYQGPITLPKPKPAKTVALTAIPAFGSTFVEWGGACSGAGACEVTMNEAAEVTATFTALPSKTLTVAKNAYATGTGTVSSKPKGIKCAATCTTQSVAMPEGASVVLTEKPASGMTFVEWEGGGCTASTSSTCTVAVSSSKTVTAKFSGTPKAIAEAKELTLTKAGSGFGTVKASGLACEVACTSAVSLYAGPVTLPKPKPAATVILEGISAPGSKTVAWSGCDSETEGKCVVTMETSRGVTATFDELE